MKPLKISRPTQLALAVIAVIVISLVVIRTIQKQLPKGSVAGDEAQSIPTPVESLKQDGEPQGEVNTSGPTLITPNPEASDQGGLQ